jgi:hypothetical protein
VTGQRTGQKLKDCMAMLRKDDLSAFVNPPFATDMIFLLALLNELTIS